MTEHKFTDEEIIKALEICAKNTVGREGYFTYQGIPLRYLCEDALDLINRQKAEIAKLEAMIDAAEEHFTPLPFKNKFDEYIEKSKTEAIEEFAERLKTYYRNLDKTAGALIEYHIDEIVKEMLEGDVCGANTETEK
jgi:hypothetical protein